MPSYLENLTIRLAVAVAELPAAVRSRHANYLLAAQRADGGFAGREGESDLYYTGFALRSLAVLGVLQGEVAASAASFLQSKMQGEETIVDFVSLIFGASLIENAAGIDVFASAGSDWPDSVAAALEKLRRDDGGYAKGTQGAASSTYHTFLVLLCLELLKRPPPNPREIVRFLYSQAAEDGGFLEIRASKRAGVNPTAAAIAALRILKAFDDDRRELEIDFLADMQTDEGGLRANTRIPIADVLSTFTGLLTLEDLGAKEEIDLATALQFVKSLERPQGGFHAAAWDDSHDVEYTFYGLGCLALLNPSANRA